MPVNANSITYMHDPFYDFDACRPMKIPHQQLSTDALQALVEEFITRNGTDYGDAEVSLEQKTTQVIRMLDKGDIVIVFDAATESCTIVTKQHALKLEEENVTDRL
ncbi:MAG: YheU family protein [Gammaproteobacteria bacterium]